MNTADKKEFLEYAKEFAGRLEEHTDKKYMYKIGWIENHEKGIYKSVYLCINHEDWFMNGDYVYYNVSVLFDISSYFVPVPETYLVFNDSLEIVLNH